MKIYTKKGDKGSTSLLGGKRVSKDSSRIEAYGSVDELNSWTGLLRDETDSDEVKAWLGTIQNELFVIGSHLALDPDRKNMPLPQLNPDFITFLEQSIDSMESTLPELRNFILPGGHRLVSYCHIARCVCRRAERNTVALSVSETVDEQILTALNRLSDFLFVLARKTGYDLNISEQAWTPRK